MRERATEIRWKWKQWNYYPPQYGNLRENDRRQRATRVQFEIPSYGSTLCVCVCIVVVIMGVSYGQDFYFQFTMICRINRTSILCDIPIQQRALTICQNQPISHCVWHHQHKIFSFCHRYFFCCSHSLSLFLFALIFPLLFVQLIITFSHTEIGCDSMVDYTDIDLDAWH